MRALLSIQALHRDVAGRSIAPNVSRLSGPGHNLFMTSSGPIDVGDGLTVRVLDLDALIDVKREVAREKDLATLSVPMRTLEERRRREG